MTEIREVLTIAEYEGVSIEEAKLSYAARQNLPATAFCGPDKSYPAHDAKCVREGLRRLSQLGKKMPKVVALKIYRRLRSRAQKYSIEVDETEFDWLTGRRTVEEAFQEMDNHDAKMLNWLYETNPFEVEEALWIAKAGIKKGALRAQLGIKEDEKIPVSFLQRVAKAEVGTTVSFRGKSIKVTTQLKRRVLLALKFKKMHK